jgi:hypothetical protein
MLHVNAGGLPFRLLLQIVRVDMAVETIGPFCVHGRRMRLAMACLTLRNAGMRYPMAEGTGKGLMFGGRPGHQLADLFVARDTETPRCRHGN